MAIDRKKANARAQRYRARDKIKKFGPQAAGRDLRGHHGMQPKGSHHYRWTNARMVTEHGYIKIRVGLEHPLADPNGYAYEHLLVWASAGRALPRKDELLHHDNDDKQDNRLQNLILTKRPAHGEHHIAARARDLNGRLLPKAGRLLDGIEHNGFPDAP